MPKLRICTQYNWLSDEETWSSLIVLAELSLPILETGGLVRIKGWLEKRNLYVSSQLTPLKGFSNELTAVPLLSLNTS